MAPRQRPTEIFGVFLCIFGHFVVNLGVFFCSIFGLFLSIFVIFGHFSVIEISKLFFENFFELVFDFLFRK